jgi:hypothetical protein
MEIAMMNRKRSSRILMKEMERLQREAERTNHLAKLEAQQLDAKLKQQLEQQRQERARLREQRAREREMNLRETRKRKREANMIDFDCICGQFGSSIDDQQPVISCKRCGVWQHVYCVENALVHDPSRDWSNTEFWCQPCEQVLKQRRLENGVTKNI